MIQPVISGTAHSKVMQTKEPTMYTFRFIHTPLLSLDAVLKLVEYYVEHFSADHNDWKLSLPFLQLVSDMGGLPRAISYLFGVCFGHDYSGGSDFFAKLSKGKLCFSQLFHQVCNSISEKYGLNGFIHGHKEAVLHILDHAIHALPLTRDKKFDKITLEELELLGHVFLHPIDNNFSVLRMPFIFLYLYNQYLRIIPFEIANLAFNHDAKVTWQDWEIFNAVYQVFVNNFLYEKGGKTKLTLGNFYYKADGQDDTKKLCFKLEPLELVPVLHQFPSKTKPVVHKGTGREVNWTACRYLLLNERCAEFGDTVMMRAAEKQSAQKYFGRKVNIIIVSGQQKWDYNGKPFTLKQALEEHKKAQDTAAREGLSNTYGLVTVIFTSQPFPKDKIKFIPKDILIIHRDNFKEYYGPFADRAAFSLASHLNPNFADIPHLMAIKGVGQKVAKKIATERKKQPFKSIDDLCTRVKHVKKSAFSSQHSFFPFSSNYQQPTSTKDKL